MKRIILIIALLALLLTLAAWEVWEAPGTFNSSPIAVPRATRSEWITGYVER